VVGARRLAFPMLCVLLCSLLFLRFRFRVLLLVEGVVDRLILLVWVGMRWVLGLLGVRLVGGVVGWMLLKLLVLQGCRRESCVWVVGWGREFEVLSRRERGLWLGWVLWGSWCGWVLVAL
jgi:hypothetical protein